MPNSSLPTLSAHRSNLIVVTILLLYPLVGMGIDLISPSLPAMSHALNVSHTYTKNLISVFLIGYAFGNFVTGFLSDAWGRRYLMLIGLAMFFLVSLSAALFPNAIVLMIVRVLQGFSIGIFGVLARAIMVDILPSEKMIRTAMLITTMWGIGPIIGPVIGGYLQYYFDWQACFYFYAIFCFVGLVAMSFVLPETLKQKHSLSVARIKNNVLEIIRHRVFLGLIVMMGFTYSLLIVFNTTAPFLIQVELGHTPIYFGHIALVMGTLFLIGSLLCRQLVKYYSNENLMNVVLIVSIIFSIIFLALMDFNDKSILMIVIPSFFMFFACGVIYPAAMSKGMSFFQHLAGSASAIMNLVNVLIASLVSIVMSSFYATSAAPLLIMYVVLVSGAFLVYRSLVATKAP